MTILIAFRLLINGAEVSLIVVSGGFDFTMSPAATDMGEFEFYLNKNFRTILNARGLQENYYNIELGEPDLNLIHHQDFLDN